MKSLMGAAFAFMLYLLARVSRASFYRIVSNTERNTTTVESQSLYGIAVVKRFLQLNGSVDRAIAQIKNRAGTLEPLVGFQAEWVSPSI